MSACSVAPVTTPAAAGPAVAHLLGQGRRFEPAFVLVACAPRSSRSAAWSSVLIVSYLSSRPFRFLTTSRCLVVGLLGLVGRGLFVRGLDRRFEVGDDRFHVVLGEPAERLGRVRQELLLFALVEPVVGEEAEHGPEPAGDLLGLALEPALGLGLVRRDRTGRTGRGLDLGRQRRAASARTVRVGQRGGHGNSSSDGPAGRRVGGTNEAERARLDVRREGEAPANSLLVSVNVGRMQSQSRQIGRSFSAIGRRQTIRNRHCDIRAALPGRSDYLPLNTSRCFFSRSRILPSACRVWSSRGRTSAGGQDFLDPRLRPARRAVRGRVAVEDLDVEFNPVADLQFRQRPVVGHLGQLGGLEVEPAAAGQVVRASCPGRATGPGGTRPAGRTRRSRTCPRFGSNGPHFSSASTS